MTSEVFNEDCMIGMSKYPDKFFDLAVVDPPYGIGKKLLRGGKTGVVKFHEQYEKNEWDNDRPPEEYFKELFRVSLNQIIWGGNYYIDYLYPSRGVISWDKKLGEPYNFSHWEMAWTSFDCIARRTIISSNQRQSEHPTEKPVKLYSWIYNNYLPKCNNKHTDEYKYLCTDCNRTFKVLDTHLGSGSNRIAADKAGNIDFYGFEIDKDYFEAQEKRWADYKKQLTLFL